MDRLFKDVTLAGGGVVPQIHKSLIRPSSSAGQAFGAGGFGAPTFGAGGFGAPAFGAGGFGTGGFGAPVPAFGASAFGAGGFDQSF